MPLLEIDKDKKEELEEISATPELIQKPVNKSTVNHNIRENSISKNIYSEPDGTIVRVIPKGTKIVILEENGEWVKVEDGWISNQYLC